MKKYTFLLAAIFNIIFTTVSYSQWHKVKAFTGGPTSYIASDGNTIYSYVGSHGLIKSTDSGIHWKLVNDSMPFNNYDANSVTAEGSRILLRLTGASNHAYYSMDSGLTWQNISINGGIGLYDFKFYKGKIIATGFQRPIYVSDDDGTTWTIDSLSSYLYYKIVISEERIFLVPQYNGPLYTSYDTCKTWVSLGNLPDEISGYSSFPFAAKGDTLAAIVNLWQYLIISTNLGAGWDTIPGPVLFNYYSRPAVYFDKDTLYLMANDSIYSTYDLGLTWNFRAYYPGLFATSIIKSGSNLLIGSYNHAFIKFRPSDNSTQKMARGINAVPIKDIKCKGDTVLVVSNNLVYYSYNNGESWGCSKPFESFTNTNRYCLDVDTGAVYLGQYAEIFRSKDWGKTWKAYDTIPGGNIKQILYHNGKLYYAAGSTVYVGNNKGGKIKKYGSIGSNGDGIYKIAICKNKLFALSDNNIYATDLDSIPQWSVVNSGITNLADFTCMASTDSAIYIGGYDKCTYRCYPPDTVWENLGMYHWRVMDMDGYHNYVFSASAYNHQISFQPNSQGQSWIPFNGGLHVSPIRFAISDNNMYCGGSDYTRGLYRRSVSDLSAPAGIDETCNESDLHFSAYPNPASDYLQVDGFIQSLQAEINLIDITGRTCYHRRIFSKGDYTIEINVNSLPDGIYIMNLTDGGKKYSQKIVIKKS